MPPNPQAKGMASLSCAYVQGIALTHANLQFRKKILTSYQILYTLLSYLYKLIKDIKYKFLNSNLAVIQQKTYSYLTHFKNVAFHGKKFLPTTTKGPPPRCLPQGPHHPRSTPVNVSHYFRFSFARGTRTAEPYGRAYPPSGPFFRTPSQHSLLPYCGSTGRNGQARLSSADALAHFFNAV